MPTISLRSAEARDIMAGASRRKEASKDVLNRVQKAWGESPFYQAKLRGPAPDRILFQPEDPFTPERDVARALVNGRLVIGDESVDCEGEIDQFWEAVKPGGAASSFLQEFAWLRHLSVLGDDARTTARLLTAGWLDRFEKWSSEAWEPYAVSERLLLLVSYHPLVLGQSDAMWRSRVLTSMARQTRHLANSAHRAETGLDRLMTALGLCIAAYSLPGCDAAAARGLEMARRELRLQLRPDGGHLSRNPSRQLKLAVRIATVVNAIEARGFDTPGFLRHMKLRAGAMTSFFRCGDGRLAVFNGGFEDDSKAVLAVEKALQSEAPPSGFARYSGYHKLTAGRSLLILDSGNDAGAQHFKSAGSFHFSSGRSRIFGNCGSGGHRPLQWRTALMQREAHTTLSFDVGTGKIPAFGMITHHRAEDEHGGLVEFERALLTADHPDGLWKRRLFLAAGGADLRGEDCLSNVAPDAAARGVWRFHLHPQVRASLARDRKSVLLLLPNKEGWRFKSNAGLLELEKSIYCGAGGAPVSAEQIVLRISALAPRADGCVIAKWAFRRLDAM